MKLYPSFEFSPVEIRPSTTSEAPFTTVTAPAVTVTVATATIKGAAAPHVNMVAAVRIAVTPTDTSPAPEKISENEKLPASSDLFICVMPKYTLPCGEKDVC